jgi:hypothetical protein
VKRISSDTTFYYKKGMPSVWLGFIALFVIDFARDIATGRGGKSTADFLGPSVFILSLYVFWRIFLSDLVDEVFDDGEHLVVRRGAQRERISLSDIAEVTEFFRNPRRVTLKLVKPGTLGREITFVPAGKFWNQFSSSPIARELNQRAAAARAQRAR